MLRGPRELLKGCKLPGLVAASSSRRRAATSRDKLTWLAARSRCHPADTSRQMLSLAANALEAVVQNAVKRGPESSYPQCQLELAAALAALTRKRIAVRKNDDVCHRARPSELL